MHLYIQPSLPNRFFLVILLCSLLCFSTFAYATPSSKSCGTCGVITSISSSHNKGQGGIAGKVGGGIAGGLLGSQLGGGTGKTVGTIVGVLGGAYAGNEVEKQVTSTETYHVHVKLNNGSRHTVHFDHDPQLVQGQAIQLKNGQLIRR